MRSKPGKDPAMTDVYDVYGGDFDLGLAMTKVSAALGVELVPHSSDYLGGDYYRTRVPDDSIEVARNGPCADPDDVPYDEFSVYRVIVEVNESPKYEEYREKLIAAGFEHLQRDTVGPDDDAPPTQ